MCCMPNAGRGGGRGGRGVRGGRGGALVRVLWWVRWVRACGGWRSVGLVVCAGSVWVSSSGGRLWWV